MHAEVTDRDLITKVLAGDQAAFSGLVKRYQDYVFTLTLRFTKNREDAEEVAQDVFVKAYKALADYKGTAKFSTWLYTVVYTTSISFLRKKKMNTTSIDDDQHVIQLENHESSFMANTIEQKSKLNSLNQAIGMLSPDDAAIITLFYKSEQSLDEIAKILTIEANAVKVRLHRARQRLREKMEQLLKGEFSDMRGY
jgi:RNA polymerase sigma factor (sigma-70 family)